MTVSHPMGKGQCTKVNVLVRFSGENNIFNINMKYIYSLLLCHIILLLCLFVVYITNINDLLFYCNSLKGQFLNRRIEMNVDCFPK